MSQKCILELGVCHKELSVGEHDVYKWDHAMRSPSHHLTKYVNCASFLRPAFTLSAKTAPITFPHVTLYIQNPSDVTAQSFMHLDCYAFLCSPLLCCPSLYKCVYHWQCSTGATSTICLQSIHIFIDFAYLFSLKALHLQRNLLSVCLSDPTTNFKFLNQS